jgi:hypothetical protein
LYEDDAPQNAPQIEDQDFAFFVDFVYKFLAKYKEDFYKNIEVPAKNSKLTIGKKKREKYEKNPPQINTTEAKQKIDKILDSFKKRVTYKKNYYRSHYTNEINNRYNESDIKKSFSDLLELTKTMNQNIVANFVTKMVKNEDLNKMLNEAEQGFTPQLNALTAGVNLFKSVYNFFDNLLGDKWEDIKFKIDGKGYFTEIYNENAEIKEPTLQDLRMLKYDLIQKLNETCDYIEKVLNQEIDKTKQVFSEDNIKKFLETNEK